MRSDLDMAVELLQGPKVENLQAALHLIQGTVFSFSMKLCRHREDAEDTTQDVLISSLKHLAKIPNSSALSVWLYTAVRNRCWRNRSRAAHAESVSLDDLTGDDRHRLLAATGLSPEQKASQDENDYLFRNAVSRLPPQYRIVMALHDMEDLDTDQVAQALFLEPGAVRVRLHRARLLLRKEVEAVFGAHSKRHRHPERVTTRPSRDCGGIVSGLSKYPGSGMESRGCGQIPRHMEACSQYAGFIRDLKLVLDRCRSLRTPACASVDRVLQRLLAEECQRLNLGGTSLAPHVLAS